MKTKNTYKAASLGGTNSAVSGSFATTSWCSTCQQAAANGSTQTRRKHSVLLMGGTGEVGHHDDLSKARERLGFDPPSDLRHSVKLVVEWAKQTNRI